MRYLLMACGLLAISVTLVTADDAAEKQELKALQGKWKVVAGERGGQEIPKDSLPPITFVMPADGTATVQTPEGQTQATLSLDPSKLPKTLNIVHVTGTLQGKKQYAIYKLEKDRLTIIATATGAMAEDRPRDFTTKDVKAVLYVFERTKP